MDGSSGYASCRYESIAVTDMLITYKNPAIANDTRELFIASPLIFIAFLISSSTFIHFKNIDRLNLSSEFSKTPSTLFMSFKDGIFPPRLQQIGIGHVMYANHKNLA